MTNARTRLLALVPLAVVAAVACGGSSGTPAGGASGSTVATSPATGTSVPATGPAITISGFSFGAALTVKAGQKITVKNADAVTHTVTADDGKSFGVTVNGNGSATFSAPSKPGTYKFHCTIHPQMHGTLIVTS